jgi:hypothetical protein
MAKVRRLQPFAGTPHAHLQTDGLGTGEVDLALPIRLASTEDSVSY